MVEPAVDAWVLCVPEALEDEVTGLVWTAGCSGITIERASADTVRLVCFFEAPDDHAARLHDLAAAFSITALRIRVPNPDWVQRFEETFVSFDAPPFRIVPAWVETGGLDAAHSTGAPAQVIRVDPGRAFGTGTHESTRLCLRALGAIAPSLPPSPRTLDLGCGAGILGIAASKLVGARVTACDFDPLATSSSHRHGAMNGVTLQIVLMDGGRGFRDGAFNLVFANLMAPFLIDRVAEIAAVGGPGCRFILAGLLRDEEAAVRAAWPEDWAVSSSTMGEWASLVYTRP